LRGSDRTARESYAATLGMILRYLRAALTSRVVIARHKGRRALEARVAPRIALRDAEQAG